MDPVRLSLPVVGLRERYRQDLAGRRSRASEIVDRLFMNPFVTAPRVARELGITNQGAQYLLGQLEAAGIIRPVDLPGGRAKRWVAQEVYEAVGR